MKEKILLACHYLDLLLSEFGRRAGLSFWQMKYSLPGELAGALLGKLQASELDARMKNCIVVWKKGAVACEFAQGGNALAREKEIFAKDVDACDVAEVSGTVASKGFAKGRAYVTMSPTDAAQMPKGSILITAMTSPDFVVAMRKAAAIVTDWGGMTSHAAIVSRELGVPCVVGTSVATKAFKTGDLLEVDANLGVVKKVSEW